MKIKEIPIEERPREKMIRHGAKILSDAELLAIILRTGSRKENVIELSKNLLKGSNIKSLSRKRINSLKNNLGVGQSKACQIVACFELGRRLASFRESRILVDNAADVASVFMAEMSPLKKEHFKAVFLDSRKRIIKEETIFIGSLNASVVHPREVFDAAFEEGAAAMVLLHNHPSGDPSPSDDDIEMTKQLVESGKILGIEVLDHIIIGSKKYFSFREKGAL